MILHNKALIEHVFEYDVVLVPMSVNNSMSTGFRYEIALNFPHVRDEESKTNYGDRRKYGTITQIECDGIVFCICYMFRTRYKKTKDNDTVDYDALKSCLDCVNKKYKGLKIASPLLGVSEYDGNGDEYRVKTIFEETLPDADIFIYEQEDYKKKIFKEIAWLHSLLKEKDITPEEYIKRRSETEWRRRYGIFKKMPEDYMYIPRKGEITTKTNKN